MQWWRWVKKNYFIVFGDDEFSAFTLFDPSFYVVSNATCLRSRSLYYLAIPINVIFGNENYTHKEKLQNNLIAENKRLRKVFQCKVGRCQFASQDELFVAQS